eukprot:210549-Chlamydomonas_euryale.AAC.2
MVTLHRAESQPGVHPSRSGFILTRTRKRGSSGRYELWLRFGARSNAGVDGPHRVRSAPNGMASTRSGGQHHRIRASSPMEWRRPDPEINTTRSERRVQWNGVDPIRRSTPPDQSVEPNGMAST